MPSIRALLSKRVNNILRRILGNSQKTLPTRIFGFKEFCVSSPARKALLSYLVSPLLPPPLARDRILFSNLGIAQSIPRVLNELGYEVDIVEWSDTEWLPQQHYDLFIGHGGINFEHISHALSEETTQIYFSTGIYWREWNIRGAKRIYELALRKGYALPPDRPIKSSEEYANQIADGIICLGNQNAVESYSQFSAVIGINNATYPLAGLNLAGKDFELGRQHFLFFSGGGNIHKGLDLLLDAFVGTELHLHICQGITPGFADVYKDELTRHPNIHLYGHIPMRSSEFLHLASLCNWTISTTSCEGQPGAVLECMAYGLIPILTIDANIDIENFGIFLLEINIAAIRKIILDVAKMNVDECRQRAALTAAVIKEKYSPENFNINFKNAVREIVERKTQA